MMGVGTRRLTPKQKVMPISLNPREHLWVQKTENDGKHMNENTNTYEAHDNTSALGSVSASLATAPSPISESANDKATMRETKTSRDALISK